MSNGIRRTGMWALLLVAAVTACSDSSTGPSPGTGPGYTPVRIPQPNTGPNILHDNVVVIDSTVLHMASSPAAITAGDYRFDVVGSPVPLIEVGDVVAGPEGLGFMGIVTSISYGTQVVVRATQATLTDIIKEGSFSINEPINLSVRPPAPGSALAPMYYLAPGVNSSGRLINLTNVDLCDLVKEAKKAGLPVQECPEWISLTLPSGYVDFTPRILFDAGIVPPRVEFAVKGDLVFEVTAKAVASQAFSIDGEVVLKSIPVPLPPPPYLPFIRPTAVVSLKAGYEANAVVEARVQSGIHLEAGVEVGGNGTLSGWTPIWKDTLDVSATETSWVAQGNGDVRVYVRPEVQLVVSSVEGPYAGLEPYLKVYGAVGTEECRVRLTRALDADVVLTAAISGHSLPKLVFAWPGTETNVIDPIPCPIGHLKVETTTNGSSPDPDGYTVTLDQSDPKPIMNMGSVMYSPLPPATYTVELTGLANNCTVSLNPRSIMVPAGDTTLVSFPVICGDPVPVTGAIKVNTTTTGQDDGYSVMIDGDTGGAMPIGTDGTVTFESLVAGNHTVELTGFGSSCVVSGDNPRTVAVADLQVETDFQVDCGLTVHAMTTGSDPDPDGYDVTVDGGSPTALADINGTLWLDIAPGVHSVELSGLADGCSVSGDNPRDVTAPGEETFEVACDGTSGSAITFVSDFNVWQINPDGTGEQQLTIDGVGAYTYLFPSWSPDGTRMAFTRGLDCGGGNIDCVAVFTSDADGSNAVQVTFPVTSTFDQFPKWSPDGSRLVFWRQDNIDYVFSIMTVNPDGTNLIELLTGNGADPTVEVRSNYFDPSWTPDGQIVYVEELVDNRGTNYEDNFVSVMNADGSGSRRLTTFLRALVSSPEYSPQGDRILFRRRFYLTGEYDHVIVMNADGSGLTDLSNGLYDVYQPPRWSPDGSQIAYTGHPAGFPPTGLWLMDADGNNQTRLIDGGWQLAWRTLP